MLSWRCRSCRVEKPLPLVWYVLLGVVSSKTAVPSQHLRRVLVVADGVLGVRETKAVHRLVSDSCPSRSGVRPVFCRGCPFSAKSLSLPPSLSSSAALDGKLSMSTLL